MRRIILYLLFFTIFLYINIFSNVEKKTIYLTTLLSYNRDQILTYFAEDYTYLTSINFIDGKYVRVWYREKDIDTNNVILLRNDLDNVFDSYIKLGFNLPPSDSLLSMLLGVVYDYGGDSKIDIYIMPLKSKGFLAITYPDNDLVVFNSYNTPVSSAFAIIDNTIFNDSLLYKITLYHEMFHVIQQGYRTFLQTDIYGPIHSIMEASSVFMEEYFYPDVNDYIQYVDDYFNAKVIGPIAGYYTSSVESYYGSALWLIYLNNINILKKIWENINMGNNTIESIKMAFLTEGEDFNNFWDDFLKNLIYLNYGKSNFTDSKELPFFNTFFTLNKGDTTTITSIGYSSNIVKSDDKTKDILISSKDSQWRELIVNIEDQTYYAFYNTSVDEVTKEGFLYYGESEYFNIYAYPNPFTMNDDSIVIEGISLKDKNFYCDIYNINGKKIDGFKIKSNKIPINIFKTSGIYFIFIYNNIYRFNLRVVFIK